MVADRAKGSPSAVGASALVHRSFPLVPSNVVGLSKLTEKISDLKWVSSIYRDLVQIQNSKVFLYEFNLETFQCGI